MSFDQMIRCLCLGLCCLATLACGVEGFEIDELGDLAAEAIPGQLMVMLDEPAQHAVTAIELYWHGDADAAAEGRLPFFAARPADDPEAWISQRDFHTRPGDSDALETVVYLDGRGAPAVVTLRVPVTADEIETLEELELALQVTACERRPADECVAGFHLLLIVDLCRSAHDEVTLHPMGVPRAARKRERLVFALANGLGQPIFPDYAGESFSLQGESMVFNMRGLTCGTVQRFSTALAGGEHRLVGEPYYITGVLPLREGEHLYRFLYRMAEDEIVCVEGGCALKRTHFRATARFSVR
jgi:hypothetical protein